MGCKIKFKKLKTRGGGLPNTSPRRWTGARRVDVHANTHEYTGRVNGARVGRVGTTRGGAARTRTKVAVDGIDYRTH